MGTIAFQPGAIVVSVSSIPQENTRSHFRCLHGKHDKGTLFLFRTTRNDCVSGEWPALEALEDGGVGVILMAWKEIDRC